MENHIKKLFNQSILIKALARYGIKMTDTQSLDGFESFIYRVHRADQDAILRIGHDSRRDLDMVSGEVAFLNHLAVGGLSVPCVLSSNSGRLVESIRAADGSYFITTLFEKAPGQHPNQAQWVPSLFRNMGRFMGKLHQLSRHFKPSQFSASRFNILYDMQKMRELGSQYLPPEDASILHAYDETTQDICALPINEACYGLCHIDFHRGNFFITDKGKITLFDFDDCQYAWYVYDIAMALFYAIPHHCTTPEALADALRFLANFWDGYKQENLLGPTWLLEIPRFLRLREIELYILIHRSLDLENLDPWTASFMKNRREKILQKVPYCSIDYSAFLD